ncbi:hypothetical protein BB559_005027 [Furculomyces boomerangus]|uniref:Uncharacterized protein n=1 Tax=Furculomyces boomerangus TaxID=61424 RepID=A0A2T9YB64_9FUNG|nr:hypothetical protein BB559_005027 [Furculomyces boomerangus]
MDNTPEDLDNTSEDFHNTISVEQISNDFKLLKIPQTRLLAIGDLVVQISLEYRSDEDEEKKYLYKKNIDMQKDIQLAVVALINSKYPKGVARGKGFVLHQIRKKWKLSNKYIFTCHNNVLQSSKHKYRFLVEFIDDLPENMRYSGSVEIAQVDGDMLFDEDEIFVNIPTERLADISEDLHSDDRNDLYSSSRFNDFNITKEADTESNMDKDMDYNFQKQGSINNKSSETPNHNISNYTENIKNTRNIPKSRYSEPMYTHSILKPKKNISNENSSKYSAYTDPRIYKRRITTGSTFNNQPKENKEIVKSKPPSIYYDILPPLITSKNSNRLSNGSDSAIPSFLTKYKDRAMTLQDEIINSNKKIAENDNFNTEVAEEETRDYSSERSTPKSILNPENPHIDTNNNSDADDFPSIERENKRQKVNDEGEYGVFYKDYEDDTDAENESLPKSPNNINEPDKVNRGLFFEKPSVWKTIEFFENIASSIMSSGKKRKQI